MDEYRNIAALMRLAGMGNVHATKRRFHSTAAGSSVIGRIIGTAIAAAVSEVIDDYTESAARANAEEAERSELRREYNRKMANLPSNCPNCGAPTCGKMYCEYCESKIV